MANTPLILQDENGEDVRVERGEVIMLSDTQYAEVAAHVTLVSETDDTANATTSAHLADGQPENPPETPSESPEHAESADKPKRGKKDAE